MMPALVTIDKQNKLSPAEDYHFLRKEGIRLIQGLAGTIWTDYNTHDPGITLLEALCYALTDLGYRANFDIKDILTPASQSPENRLPAFYTARQILPNHPITLLDYRKLIIDVEGVRNAWLEISDEAEIHFYLQPEESTSDTSPAAYQLTYDAEDNGEILRLQGLYQVFVEYDSDIIDQQREEEIAQTIKDRLHARRNLCEDFINVTSIEYAYFNMEAEVQVSEGTDIEKINARMYEVIYNFFSPAITFYSLEQMFSKGYAAEEIFAGPLLRHGFIDDQELIKSEKYNDVHLSDIMNLISGIEGVIAIKKFNLPQESESAFSDFTQWLTNVKESRRAPRLDVENSRVTFIRSGDRHRSAAEKQPNKARVLAMFSFLQSANFKSRLKGTSKDLPVPTGEFMDLSEYYPVQKSLPAVYGLAETYLEPPLDRMAIRRAAYDLLDANVGISIRMLLEALRLQNSGNKIFTDQLNVLLVPDLSPEEVSGTLAQIFQDKFNASFITHRLSELLSDAPGDVPVDELVNNLFEKHRQNPLVLGPVARTLYQVAAPILSCSLLEVDQEAEIRLICDAFRLQQVKQLDKKQRLALQLRGFLMVFEQILADYLNQLTHVRQTLSIYQPLDQTYFPQPLAEVPDRAALLLDSEKYQNEQTRLMESESTNATRRNRFLDHLLGRFSEDLTKYGYFLQATAGQSASEILIADKKVFLADYVAISTYRSQAFNYRNSDPGWKSTNVSGTKKRICRLLGIKDFATRPIASDAIFIQEITVDDKVQRYVVVLTDPEDKSRVLLKSLEYEFESEARVILNYMLTSGADGQLYEKEGRPHKWSYQLKRITNEDDYEIIASNTFASQQPFEEAFDRTMAVLRQFSADENFHLIEHILLRPKISFRERSGKRSHGLNADSVDFLEVNPVPVVKPDFVNATGTPVYKFRILNNKNEGQTNWRLTLTKDDTGDIFVVNEDFVFYKHATRRLEQIRQFASDRANFAIEENADGYFIFRLLDTDRILGESKKRYRQQEELEAELQSLVTFFSSERKFTAGASLAENPVTAQADPYSFQVSILLPDWPAKFRNKTFKHLLEKTIYMEIPAHIYPQVYWVDHKQMREFEEAYQLWLEELPLAEIPNTEILNNLIYQLNELRKNKGDANGSY